MTTICPDCKGTGTKTIWASTYPAIQTYECVRCNGDGKTLVKLQKFMLWRNDMAKNANGERWCNVHILRGYTQQHITDYIALADEMKITFPMVTHDQVSCGLVTESDRYKKFTIATFDGYIPEGDYPEYTVIEHFPYRWM